MCSVRMASLTLLLGWSIRPRAVTRKRETTRSIVDLYRIRSLRACQDNGKMTVVSNRRLARMLALAPNPTSAKERDSVEVRTSVPRIWRRRGTKLVLVFTNEAFYNEGNLFFVPIKGERRHDENRFQHSDRNEKILWS